MPILLRYKGYVFFFFSNEGSPREHMHVHVRRGTDSAKIWLEPAVLVAVSHGFSAPEIGLMLRVVGLNRLQFEKAWKEFFHA